MDFSAVSEFFSDFTPYESHSLTAVTNRLSPNGNRFNPYARSSAVVATASESKTSKASGTRSKRAPKPTPAAAAVAGERKFKNQNHQNMRFANEDY
ncbi:hypothetical protein PENTCL1PPCAC_883, partial [Pristionchus entomophagus]